MGLVTVTILLLAEPLFLMGVTLTYLLSRLGVPRGLYS